MQKKILHLTGAVIKKIKKARVWLAKMSQRQSFRIIIIGLFLGINIALFPQFLKTNRIAVPDSVAQVFAFFGLDVANKLPLFYPAPEGGAKTDIIRAKPSLDPAILTEKINEARIQQSVEPLLYSEALSQAAETLMQAAAKTEYEVTQKDFIAQLRSAMEGANYDYSRVSHNMVVGPLLEDGVINAWYSDATQREALVDPEFTEVGFATTFIEQEPGLELGVVVQLLAKPQKTQAAAQPSTKVTVTVEKNTQKPAPTPAFPFISGYDVFTALNIYRQTHGIPQLTEHHLLCKYAEKRVADLVTHGGLDGHAGFSADFADYNKLPQAIKDYPGKTIAENLAYQHCKNMQTGDSFVAQNATALIEWCFDSSTAGHREAQLNPKFNNVCIRTDKNYYVVIFGD